MKHILQNIYRVYTVRVKYTWCYEPSRLKQTTPLLSFPREVTSAPRVQRLSWPGTVVVHFRLIYRQPPPPQGPKCQALSADGQHTKHSIVPHGLNVTKFGFILRGRGGGVSVYQQMYFFAYIQMLSGNIIFCAHLLHFHVSSLLAF